MCFYLLCSVRDGDAREESADIPGAWPCPLTQCGTYLLPVPRSPRAVGEWGEKMAEHLLVGQVGEGGEWYTLHRPIGFHL